MYYFIVNALHGDHGIVYQFSDGNTTLHPVLGSHSANLRFHIIDLMMNLTSIQEEDLKIAVPA